MYGRRTGRIEKTARKRGVFMSAILKQKLIDIANGFTKYGLWKGGSSALSEMTDVTFTNLQANDVLKYNGSVWINDDNLHDYSTEEKIVGKWVDGKSIYEKVIITNGFIATGDSWYSTDIDFNYNCLECYIITNDGIGYPAIATSNNGKLAVMFFIPARLEFNTIIIKYIY